MADKYLGTIAVAVAGTPKDNTDTAVPFVIPTSAKLTLQPDAACYLKFHETAAEAKVVAANGLKLVADQIFTSSSPSRGSAPPTSVATVPSARLSVDSVAGAANLKVFERQGNEA